MLCYASFCETNEVPARFGRVALGEEVQPSAEDRVDAAHHFLDRHEAEPRAGQVVDLLPYTLLRLRRCLDTPVPRPATSTVAATIAEPVAEEVEGRILVFDLHDPRFLAVEDQPEPALDLLLDEPDDAVVDEPRHHDEVVGIPHQSRLRPCRRSVLREERSVEPVQE